MPTFRESIPLTEQENPRTANISSSSTLDIVRLMNEEDARVAEAVRQVLPQVAHAVDQIVQRIEAHLKSARTESADFLVK